MKTKVQFAVPIAVMALVASACFGGGGDDEGVAIAAGLDDPPIAPVEATVVEGGVDLVVTDEGDTVVVMDFTEPETEDPGPPVYEYETALDRARSMVLVPEDLAAAHPEAVVDPLHTYQVTNLEDVRTALDREARAASVVQGEREAGYLAMMHDRGASFATAVDVFDEGEWAAARLNELRVDWDRAAAEAAEGVLVVRDLAGLPGAGFVGEEYAADAEEGAAPLSVHVFFASDDVVGSVAGFGLDLAGAAEVARALAVRVYQVNQGLAAPRDPHPAEAAVRSPLEVLDGFEATAKVEIRDGDEVLQTLRSRAVYAGLDDFSCQLIVAENGGESLVADVIVDGDLGYVWFPGYAGTVETSAFSAEVAGALTSCPAAPSFWRDRYVFDVAALDAATGSTGAGPAVAYSTDDPSALAAAWAWDLGPDEELVRYLEYVHVDGYLVASDYETLVPRAAAEAAYGGSYGGADKVTVARSVRLTNVVVGESGEVVVPEPLPAGGTIELAVGETYQPAPPPTEEEQAATAEGEGGTEGIGGAVEPAGTGGGEAGSEPPTEPTGAGSGGTIVGSVLDVEAQLDITDTLVALQAYYIDHGNYAALPTDLQVYVPGLSATNDPAQVNFYATVYVPEEDQVLVYGASSSGLYYCIANSWSEGARFGQSTALGEVDSYEECWTNGSASGW